MTNINFKPGDWITLVYEVNDCPTDEDLKEYRFANDLDDEELSDEELSERFIEDEHDFCEEQFDFIEEEINKLLKHSDTNNGYSDYVTISINPGYMNGFYVKVDFWLYKGTFDSYYDKQKTYRQSKELEKFMLYLTENYFVNVGDPSSCWTSGGYEETKKYIKEEFIELRKAIKAAPCYSYAKRHGLLEK